jgi:hypothetical protein
MIQKIIKKKNYYPLGMVIFLLLLGPDALSQKSGEIAPKESPKDKISITAREILQRVDLAMDFKIPFIKSKMTYVMPNADIRVYQVEIYHKENDYLYILKSLADGELERILYKFSGEKTWSYNVLARILYHKQGIDRFRSILQTDFFYFDLSGALFQANYSAKIIGREKYKKYDCFKLELYPLYRSAIYGMLTIWVDDKDFIPLRIDFHDIDKVVFKTQKIARVIKEEKSGRVIPARIDMLHIAKGTFTSLENVFYDDQKKPADSLFQHDALGR